jgi:hypothetical protein
MVKIAQESIRFALLAVTKKYLTLMFVRTSFPKDLTGTSLEEAIKPDHRN